MVAVRTNLAVFRGEASVVVAEGSEDFPPRHVGGQCGTNNSLNPQSHRYPVERRENGVENEGVINHFNFCSVICSVVRSFVVCYE